MRQVFGVMALATALALPACSQDAARPGSNGAQPEGLAAEPSAASIEISAIHWSSSNPSLGPHERTSSATVRPASFESPQAWRAAIATLLDQTRVNGVATLREYLVARRDGNVVRVATIEGADQHDLGEGGGYASVSFTTESGASIGIANLQRTRLTGEWERFWGSHIREEIEEEVPPTPEEG